jgi:hypothetical protein
MKIRLGTNMVPLSAQPTGLLHLTSWGYTIRKISSQKTNIISTLNCPQILVADFIKE